MEANTVNPAYKLELSSSPHIHSRWSTNRAMWFVIIALVPILISSVVFFGAYQLLVVLTSVIFCLLTEIAIKKIRRKKLCYKDGSAVITGILLAIVLPPNFSLSGTAIGAVFSVAIGKEIFGGLGFNIFNPALAGRAFLQAAFPVAMTTWEEPSFAVDAVTSATPLAAFKFDKVLTQIPQMIIGNTGGSIGETSAIAILLGGTFLIAVGIVNWRIPAAMIVGMIFISGIFWFLDPVNYTNPLFQIFAGGFLLGAFFMATDWVTSPITKKGMWVFGISISILVFAIRTFGGLPEGVMYAILIMNGFVPIINRYTAPKVFGGAQ